MPSSLIVMDELNERSTSMGNSVSVPVGEGGEEGKAGMVKLSARGDDDNESIMFIVYGFWRFDRSACTRQPFVLEMIAHLRRRW